MPNYNSLDYETLSVSSSVVQLTGGVTGARSFVGVVETNGVRMRTDGTDPTTTEGVLIASGKRIVLSESEIASAEFIRDGSSDGVIKGHYYNIEASNFASGIFA